MKYSDLRGKEVKDVGRGQTIKGTIKLQFTSEYNMKLLEGIELRSNTI
jgi:hypothetical protein